MPFAVMQKSPTPPSIDVLKQAFRGVPGLTQYDAYSLGKEAFGIIINGFELAPAKALQKSLAALGYETEVVDESTLPQLPEVQFLTRVDCTADGLVMYDQIDRTASLAWKDIALFAAGHVIMSEFNKPHAGANTGGIIPGIVDQMLTDTGVGGGWSRRTTVPSTTVLPSIREEQHERCLIEIIPTGAVVRYSINADRRVVSLFQYLGDRRKDDMKANFRMLVQDIARNVPQATINRGAYYIRENSSTSLVYPGKHSFYGEIIWLLWMMGVQPAA